MALDIEGAPVAQGAVGQEQLVYVVRTMDRWAYVDPNLRAYDAASGLGQCEDCGASGCWAYWPPTLPGAPGRTDPAGRFEDGQIVCDHTVRDRRTGEEGCARALAISMRRVGSGPNGVLGVDRVASGFEVDRG
jgi:hypothetical protein